MNISKIFIERPVATTIFMLALFIFGCLAYPKLPISELPSIDFPTIVVTANLSGADPETMATLVALPIEKKLSTIPNIDSMNSVSSTGSTRITLQFSLSRNIDAAAADVQNALSQVVKKLPPQMQTPPTMYKENPADSPILFLALTGDHSELTKLDDYAENEIAPQLSMVPGVAEVNVYGAQQYAVRIHLNPYALASRGLSIDTIATALQNLNSQQPTGMLQSSGHYQLIKVDGQLNNAAEFSRAVVAYAKGAPVYLKDVAEVVNSVANDKAATWFNQQPAIVLAIQRQPEANTVAVAQTILNKLPTLTKDLPGGAHLQTVYNRAVFIKTAIKDVQWTLIFAALLVVGVIYLFLRNFSLTVISLLSLPVSIVATFGVMCLLNQSLDNLSLMGLVLAVGFVIDDAIVVIENIMRYIEQGFDKMTASLKGSQEISFTVIAMTISLIAVFIPIFFMTGIIGRLFNEFAIVVSVAVLLSAVVALTLIPSLCSRFISHAKNENNNTFFEKIFKSAHQTYEKSLRWTLQRQSLMLSLAAVIAVITVLLFYWIPKGFIPSQDTGVLFGNLQAVQGVTYTDFLRQQQTVRKIVEENPNVSAVISSLGQGAGGVVSGNSGKLTIRLKPKNQRALTADEVIQQLRKQLSPVAGLKIFLNNPPAIQIAGRVSNSNYQYVLQSAHWDSLEKTAAELRERISKINGIQDVNSDLQLNNPELHLHILREKTAALGITPAQIENTLYSAYGERQISRIMTAAGNYSVLMDVDPQYQQDINALSSITLPAASGAMIPLTSVVKMYEKAGPLSIGHAGQLPAITLSFNLAPGVSLGNVTKAVQTIAAQSLPADVSGAFSGTAQKFQDSFKTLPLLFLLTLLVVYMVLAVLYEHFWHPITILTALPFAAFGTFISLLVFNQELNIFSFVGLIMLVGLAKKNGIMMIDFALAAERKEKISSQEAIIKACCVRFRPIMMTTFAAIIAILPIALGIGAGGEARQALGIAVAGGLFFSQLITLYITPAFYLFFSKVHRK